MTSGEKAELDSMERERIEIKKGIEVDKQRKPVSKNILSKSLYNKCFKMFLKVNDGSKVFYNKNHVIIGFYGSSSSNQQLLEPILDTLVKMGKSNKHIRNILDQYGIIRNSNKLIKYVEKYMNDFYHKIFFTNELNNVDLDDVELAPLVHGFKTINSGNKYLYHYFDNDYADEPTRTTKYIASFDVIRSADLQNIIGLNILQNPHKIHYIGGDRIESVNED